MAQPKAPSNPKKFIETRVEEAFRELLESKHLYQSVHVDLSGGIDAIAGPRVAAVTPDPITIFKQEASKLTEQNWICDFGPTSGSLDAGTVARVTNYVFIRPPDIKAFCTGCDRREPFNLVNAEDFLVHRGSMIAETRTRQQTLVQVFALSYVCQSCKLVPEVFVVRRDGLKLTLSGRAPIEHVDIPREIPKSISRFYSAALVAHQSGQTLAGNFLLRTLLEQYARLGAGDAQSAEEIIKSYMENLPQDFKDRFPSFRDIYGVLSADIHTATGSVEVFEQSRQDICRHFEARRLFEIGEPGTVAKQVAKE